MMASHYYKLEVERKNYGKNFVNVSDPEPLVEQYNRNRAYKDHIKSVDEIKR